MRFHPGLPVSIILVITLLTAICHAQVRTNHLVISQICLDNAFNGGVNDEFIELYNPTAEAIDLALLDYRIYRATAGGDPGLLCQFNTPSHFRGGISPSSTVIRPHGYYLIVSGKASVNLLALADACLSSNRATLTSDNKIYLTRIATPATGTIDMVGLGGALLWEGEGTVVNPSIGGSVIRKAVYSSTAVSMTNGGTDTNRGSAFDSDNNRFDLVKIGRARPRNTSVHHDPFFIPVDISLRMTDVPFRCLSRSGVSTLVFAFHYEETVGHLNLTKLAFENRGTLTPLEISNVLLYHDKDARGVFDASDVLAGPLVFNGTNAWAKESLAVTNDSDLLICIDLKSSAVDGRTFQGCIPSSGIMIETFDRSLSPLTNRSLAVTNVPPVAPTGLLCTKTNVTSLSFSWDSYPLIGDHSGFVLLYGTNPDEMTNRYPINSNVYTNVLVTSLASDRNWYFRLCARDMYGLFSTNQEWIVVKTGYISVIIEEPANVDNVYFYPNPAGKGDILRFNDFPNTTLLSVYDVKGVKVLETSKNSFMMPDSAAAGIYYIVIRNGSKKKSKVLVYQK